MNNKLDAQSRNGCSLQKSAMPILMRKTALITSDISAASALEAEDIKQGDY
jgi:hypothetical protein